MFFHHPSDLEFEMSGVIFLVALLEINAYDTFANSSLNTGNEDREQLNYMNLLP